MQEFERCPFGIIGLETAIALALEELVHPGRITLSRMVELFTTGPESVMRLGRGTLAPGAAGRRDGVQHRSGMDLRREPVVLRQPQFAVRRPHLPRRPGGHGGERPVRLAKIILHACGAGSLACAERPRTVRSVCNSRDSTCSRCARVGRSGMLVSHGESCKNEQSRFSARPVEWRPPTVPAIEPGTIENHGTFRRQARQY